MTLDLVTEFQTQNRFFISGFYRTIADISILFNARKSKNDLPWIRDFEFQTLISGHI